MADMANRPEYGTGPDGAPRPIYGGGETLMLEMTRTLNGKEELSLPIVDTGYGVWRIASFYSFLLHMRGMEEEGKIAQKAELAEMEESMGGRGSPEWLRWRMRSYQPVMRDGDGEFKGFTPSWLMTQYNRLTMRGMTVDSVNLEWDDGFSEHRFLEADLRDFPIIGGEPVYLRSHEETLAGNRGVLEYMEYRETEPGKVQTPDGDWQNVVEKVDGTGSSMMAVVEPAADGFAPDPRDYGKWKENRKLLKPNLRARFDRPWRAIMRSDQAGRNWRVPDDQLTDEQRAMPFMIFIRVDFDEDLDNWVEWALGEYGNFLAWMNERARAANPA